MKMKSILVIMMTLCLMVCLCACGGNADEGSTQTTTAATNASTTAATTTTVATTPTTTTLAEGKVNYTVKVTDEAGNPISGVPVQLCLVNCLPTMTNAEGIATWNNMDEADYKASFWRELPAGYSSDDTEFYFEDGSYEMTIVLKAVA